MPWTPESFRRRHNKRMSPAQATQAAAIANAMLRHNMSEGMAIATANARAAGPTPREKRERALKAIRRRKRAHAG